MSVKIGKSKFGGGGNRVSRKYFKLEDGDQAFRILPPIGDLADEGRWSMYYKVHYGYKNSEGKMRPFASSEVKNKEGMVEVPDAAKERLELLKGKLEEAKANGNEAQIEVLERLVGFQGVYNLDSNHYLNAIDLQGNIGVLQLRYKAKLALDNEIKKLNAEGIDPLSVENGRFFVFNRSGKNRDTAFSVTVFKEKVALNEDVAKSLGMKPGTTVDKEVVHVLTDDIINRLGTEAAQLDKIFKRLTSEEIARVVKESDLETGVSPYLDTLFAKPKTENTTPKTSGVITPNAASTGPAAQAQTAANPTVSTTPPVVVDRTETKEQVKIGKTVTPAAKPAAKSFDDMSQAEFLASLNGS